MLEVNAISATYSGMKALDSVSMRLEEGEFISIIGPNGAGKSTLLKSISGTVKLASGDICFRGRNLKRVAAHRRTEAGIIHIPEGRRIFPSLSVFENLELGAYRHEARHGAADNLRLAFEFFPILKERRNQPGGTLSGGEQQVLAIRSGLMSMPHLLMLDEPSLGLSPRMADFIFDAIGRVREKLKFGLLLVEQRALEALELCNRGYILESGQISASGDRDHLMGSPMVQRAYLGTG